MARDPYRRQMRRMRRAMRNRQDGNPYAVIILDTDEPLGLIVLAAIGKWAFRHRSALAPFGIALAAFITAAVAHAHHARYWVPVTAITVTATVVLGVPHPLLRRHRASRRIARAHARERARAMRRLARCRRSSGCGTPSTTVAVTVIAVTGTQYRA